MTLIRNNLPKEKQTGNKLISLRKKKVSIKIAADATCYCGGLAEDGRHGPWFDYVVLSRGKCWRVKSYGLVWKSSAITSVLSQLPVCTLLLPGLLCSAIINSSL